MTVDIAKLRKLEAGATKGPWETDLIPGWSGLLDPEAIVLADGDQVADCWDNTPAKRGRDETEANAKLIAALRNAAPELLDELERLRAASLRHDDERRELLTNADERLKRENAFLQDVNAIYARDLDETRAELERLRRFRDAQLGVMRWHTRECRGLPDPRTPGMRENDDCDCGYYTSIANRDAALMDERAAQAKETP